MEKATEHLRQLKSHIDELPERIASGRGITPHPRSRKKKKRK